MTNYTDAIREALYLFSQNVDVDFQVVKHPNDTYKPYAIVDVSGGNFIYPSVIGKYKTKEEADKELIEVLKCLEDRRECYNSFIHCQMINELYSMVDFSTIQTITKNKLNEMYSKTDEEVLSEAFALWKEFSSEHRNVIDAFKVIIVEIDGITCYRIELNHSNFYRILDGAFTTGKEADDKLSLIKEYLALHEK